MTSCGRDWQHLTDSEQCCRKGFGARQMAAILDKLMRSLGYNKYFCQGEVQSDHGTSFCTVQPNKVPVC